MIELNKIYNKDCIEFMKELEAESIQVDIIVTSPPYNIGKNYGPAYNDSKDRRDYLSFINEVGKNVKKILQDNGSFFLNVGNIPSDQWIATDVSNVMRKHFVLQNNIIWAKSISIESGNKIISRGHYQPINSPRYLNNCFEYIYHFTKLGNVKLDKLAEGLAVPYQDKSNIGRYSKYDKRDRGNIWPILDETIQQKREHPSVFPVELPRLCIKLHGYNKNTIVYDPFIGSGTTALPCIDLGINYLGTEINEGFFQIINTRIKEQLSKNEKKNLLIKDSQISQLLLSSYENEYRNLKQSFSNKQI